MRRVGVAGVALGLFVAACQIVAGIERVDKVGTGPGAADADGAVDPNKDSGVPDPCAHRAPPGPPDIDDDPTGDVGSFYLAIREFNLDVASAGDAGPPGYDLDGVCTCERKAGTAFDGKSSCNPRAGAAPVCDDPGGVDNASAKLLAPFGSVVPIDDAADVNKSISEGRRGILLQVNNYNGRANDKEITVGIILSAGIHDASGCGNGGVPQAPFPPGWCGRDKWTVDPTSVIGTAPNYVATRLATGYVRDYNLVVETRAAALLYFGSTTLEMGSPLATGRLVPLDVNLKPRDPSVPPTPAEKGLYRLDDGIFSGRIGARDLLAAVGTAKVPRSTGRLCNSPLFGTFKQGICEALDISKTKSFDFDPGSTCDAISTAALFRAELASVGDKRLEPESPNECSPGPDGPLDAGPGGVTYICP